MLRKILSSAAFIVSLYGFTSSAWAIPIMVDPEDIVTSNGLMFAWASPCAPVNPSCGGVPIGGDGWEVATADDFLTGFVTLQNLYDAFVIPGAGNICASDHFQSGYSHCDAGNINPQGGNIRLWNSPNTGDWASSYVQNSASETFVVMGEGEVPEPGTLFLMGGALGLLGLRVGRRKTS